MDGYLEQAMRQRNGVGSGVMEDGRGEEPPRKYIPRNGWLGLRSCRGTVPRWSPATFVFLFLFFLFFRPSGGKEIREPMVGDT